MRAGHRAPRWTAAVTILAALTACRGPDDSAPHPTPADTIYTGGDIVTVDDARPTAEALAVRGDTIVAVGSLEEVMALRGDDTRVVHLAGRCLVPGFLDGHSHFINALSIASQANVYPPPFGPGSSIATIVSTLETFAAERDLRPGEPLLAYGYDGNLLEDGRELTAADLDAAFPERPVIVQHVSLHGAVLNSAGLRRAGITADTETPPGGVIVRVPGTDEPAGLVMETAYLPVFTMIPRPRPDEIVERIRGAQRIYAEAGITTAHDGATMASDLRVLEHGAREGALEIDVIAWPFINDLERILADHPPETFGTYRGGLKLGGVKITLDGSPQGRTAWFTTPYLEPGPGGEPDWRGEPMMPTAEAHAAIARVYGLGLPLIVHGNGDAAIDEFLAAHEAALGDDVAGDHRTGIIHSQFVRPDQLERYRDWNLVPSFYTEHTYFFGDAHVALRGPEQAAFLSPMRTALDLGIRCSNHTDYPVAPIDQLFVMWTAVNRPMRNGDVLGPSERITPLEALRAITLDTAWWYREDARKGSLAVGKLADLVILDDNPLTVEPLTIKDIDVVETIKGGRTVYARDA